MNIIFDPIIAESLKDRYTVLELDTVIHPGMDNPLKLHAIVELDLSNLPALTFFKEMHSNFITAYKAGDWEIAQELGAGLIGQWNSELDSFYEMALDLCKEHAKLNKTWDGIRHTIPKNQPVE